MNCDFEGCDKPVGVKKYGLCIGHYMQTKRGTPLRPLRGQAYNRKYKEGQTCKEEDCNRPVHANYFCQAHNWQNHHYGYTWKVGTPNPGRVRKTTKGRNSHMGTNYSPTRTCVRCGETKEWQRFCLGTEHMKDVCRDCNRKALSDMALEAPEPHPSKSKKKNTVQDLLQFIEGLEGKETNRTNSDT